MLVEDEGSKIHLDGVVGEGNDGLRCLTQIEGIGNHPKRIEGLLRCHSQTQNAIVPLILEADEMPGVGAVVMPVGSKNVKGIATIDVIFGETNRVDPFPSAVERESGIAQSIIRTKQGEDMRVRRPFHQIQQWNHR